jgi:Methyltransferase domain
VEPDYAAARPTNNAKVIAQTFAASRDALSILDYGGGNGLLARALADEDILLFFTLTQPTHFDELGLRWWYVGPRNGHVSLYSRRSLAILFEKSGMRLVSLSDLVHMAFRKLPAFASHLAGV